jgi:hypothetical protein
MHTPTLIPAVVTHSLGSKADFSRAARLAVAAHNGMPVVVVEGDSAPRVRGDGYHYTTRSGAAVDHPGAYARVGWSSLVYHPSTRHVAVGAGWTPAVW